MLMLLSCFVCFFAHSVDWFVGIIVTQCYFHAFVTYVYYAGTYVTHKVALPNKDPTVVTVCIIMSAC